MSVKKKAETKAIQRYRSTCGAGNCSSLTEIENSRIRKLAERLTASSDSETLTNISEWHNNNLTYWFERYPLASYLFVSVGFFFASFLLTISYPIAWWLLAISGTITITLFIVTVCMSTYHERIPFSEVHHVFDRSISIDFLLDRKLAVCRDYAKLSSALLFNIYPKREIYFVYAPRHVSIGMLVENKLYILDKYLPVTTFLKWNEEWNKGEFSNRRVKKAKEGRMFLVDDPDSILPKTNQSKIDPSRLSTRVEMMIGIQNALNYSEDHPLQIWKWKNGARLYEDDEIINYSISRRLESILSDELLNKNKIAHLHVKREKDDLVFLVCMK